MKLCFMLITYSQDCPPKAELSNLTSSPHSKKGWAGLGIYKPKPHPPLSYISPSLIPYSPPISYLNQINTAKMKFISTISILTFLATLTLTTATASAAEDPGIRCESEADCPKDLPVVCILEGECRWWCRLTGSLLCSAAASIQGFSTVFPRIRFVEGGNKCIIVVER